MVSIEMMIEMNYYEESHGFEDSVEAKGNKIKFSGNDAGQHRFSDVTQAE